MTAAGYLVSKNSGHLPGGGEMESVFLWYFADEEVVEEMPVIFLGRVAG